MMHFQPKVSSYEALNILLSTNVRLCKTYRLNESYLFTHRNRLRPQTRQTLEHSRRMFIDATEGLIKASSYTIEQRYETQKQYYEFISQLVHLTNNAIEQLDKK